MPTSASVKVQVVLEVELASSWGPACTISQARLQAVETAERTVRIALEGGKPERERIRMVGVKCADVIIRGDS